MEKPERTGCECAAKEVKHALKEYNSYELAHQMESGEKCLLDLGSLKSGLEHKEALEELYCWVAEIFHQLPHAHVIVVGGMREISISTFNSVIDGLSLRNKLHIVILDN